MPKKLVGGMPGLGWEAYSRAMKGIMSGVGYGKALFKGAEFESGPAGTTIANLKEPIPGGDIQALGNVILVNPGMRKDIRDQLIRGHELGHVYQSEFAGPFLPLIQAGAGLVQMARGKRFYEDNPVELTAEPLAAIKMAEAGETFPTTRKVAQKAPLKSYQEGTMPAMRTRAEYKPGQATAYQSPYVVGPMGGMGGEGAFSYMQGLLERQMKLKEAMAQAQLQMMQQQQEMAKVQAQREAGAWMRQREAGRGLHGGAPHPEAGMGSFVQGMIPGGMVDPAQRTRLYNMLRAVGIPAAREGAMQSGRILGQLGGEALRTAQPMPSPFPVQPVEAPNVGGAVGSPIPQYPRPWEPVPASPRLTSIPGARLIGGRTAEKGGRVPKTGTYKLHKDEMVLNKKQSDTLFPKPVKGKPIKSYQDGTEPGATYREWGLLAPIMNLLSGRYNIPEEDPRPYAMGTQVPIGLSAEPTPPLPTGPVPLLPVETGPAPFPEERRPERELEKDIPGLTVSRAPSGVKKYELTGKPETREQEVMRLKGDAAYWGRSADYHQQKADALLSHVGTMDRPNPEVMKLLRERQKVADEYRKREEKAMARVDKLEGQEAVIEAKEAEAGGRIGAERIRQLGNIREYFLEQATKMPKDIIEIQQRYAKAVVEDEDLAEQAYVREMAALFSPYTYQMASQLDMSPEEFEPMFADLLLKSIDDPKSIEILVRTIQSALAGE